MQDTELLWDSRLHIATSGRDDTREDSQHHPYEPTPYSVLERLVQSDYITKENRLIDYGCGKGRTALFISHLTGCQSLGVDFDERMIQAAESNLRSYEEGKISNGKSKTGGNSASNVSFVLGDASALDPTGYDSFYFFNPFGEKILRSVLQNIINASYTAEDQFLLFFYYPDEETVSLLMTTPELTFMDEISTEDLFEGNDSREKILIFSID